MEPADLILQLKETIASPLAADVFKSIYMDPLLFESFEDPQAIEKIAAACGDDPEMWNPARIGFALTETGLDLDALVQTPLQPIATDIRQKVSALYQKVLRKQTVVSSLEDLVFLALALRERRRLTDSWSGLAKEITRNYTANDFSAENWTTSLAITYWLCPDKSDLLSELDSLSGVMDGISYFILISRIILSAPSNLSDENIAILTEAAKKVDETSRVKALEWLYGYGFEELTKDLSSRLLMDSTGQDAESPALESKPAKVDPLEKGLLFERMDHLAI